MGRGAGSSDRALGISCRAAHNLSVMVSSKRVDCREASVWVGGTSQRLLQEMVTVEVEKSRSLPDIL